MSTANSCRSIVLIILIMATLSFTHAQNNTCFGKIDMDTSVCSGQGVCISNNTCTCNVGYFGSDCNVVAPRYNISTIAGTGQAGYNGDGLGLESMISSPQGVAISDSGEVYISDSGNNIIRKLLLNGSLITIAGNRAAGYSGNGVPALDCQFYSPQGLSLGSNPDVLYIADTFTNTVRKLDLDTGVISTWVGSGGIGYTSPGNGNAFGIFNVIRGVCLSPNGEVIFTDTENNMVRKVYANGLWDVAGRAQTNSYLGDGGLAINAWMGIPYQIAVNSDLDIFFIDSLYEIVRKITHSTGIITTVIGTASGFKGDGGLATKASMSSPKGFALSPTGEYYVGDSNNNRIRKVYNDGRIVTIAGSNVGYSGDGGLATDATLNNPVNIAVRQSKYLNEIIVADAGNHVIRKLTAFCEETHKLIDGLCYVQCFGMTDQENGTCSGRGNCTSYNQCSCHIEGYSGSNCEEYKCNGTSFTSGSVCSGHGNCVEPEKCSCSKGYYGTNCELFDCFGVASVDSLVCSSNGQCSSYNNCSCKAGYYGSNCEMFDCFGLSFNNSAAVCSSHGKCSNYNNCTCYNGYYGYSCEQYDCFGVNNQNAITCSGHGLCSNINSCQCQEGYSGSNCEQFNCSGISYSHPSVCSGRGKCSSFNNCSCIDGSYGMNCEEFNCFGISKSDSSVCSKHGYCSNYNNCTCADGYYGNDCSLFTCFGKSSLLNPSMVCSGQGYCSSFNNCSCLNGYYGNECESFNCSGISKNDPTVCSAHGKCSSFNNCSCLDGYYGVDCKNFTCFNVNQTSPEVCSSRGKCIDKNVCVCLNSTATGDNCQNRVIPNALSLGVPISSPDISFVGTVLMAMIMLLIISAIQ